MTDAGGASKDIRSKRLRSGSQNYFLPPHHVVKPIDNTQVRSCIEDVYSSSNFFVLAQQNICESLQRQRGRPQHLGYQVACGEAARQEEVWERYKNKTVPKSRKTCG